MAVWFGGRGDWCQLDRLPLYFARREITARAFVRDGGPLTISDMARVAAEKLAAGTEEEGFYKAKLQTARFYFARILPRTRTHVETMLSGANNLMDMDEESFGLAY